MSDDCSCGQVTGHRLKSLLGLERDLTLVTIPGAGHFVQNDAAEFVSAMMKSWLEVQASKP